MLRPKDGTKSCSFLAVYVTALVPLYAAVVPESPVAEETAEFGRFAFTGTLHHVRIDLPPGGGVRADDRRRVALATH
ncbi:hypothetical protein D092_24015 [Rhodococcus ruber Chol-4]|uniref:hypothetical protein n=1 Tax=Rhodococcus TaxID=1827 RepID=UPI000371D33B|nr:MULTISPECIES: hypothetical protein [Rhodococcus]KXF83740.1 hypothetical protein D092_24015 [Rhodococcus ruber Chol-4]MBD8055845.1 hypothetical protein [Rhodococcus ruber]MCF8781302.1 hypothetical protein [Rhodococcus ruber]RQM34943.1 hypothetical protein TN91_06890 [Rhodococcus ruber]UIR35001.1 hypothetical protein LZP97_15135 [Rhodococcus sp. DMF-1]